jgi:hypothetical protein
LLINVRLLFTPLLVITAPDPSGAEAVQHYWYSLFDDRYRREFFIFPLNIYSNSTTA